MLGLPGEVAVFMHGLFPFLPEGSTKSITQQVSFAPHCDDYGDILEEESARLHSLSVTKVLKWVFCRLGDLTQVNRLQRTTFSQRPTKEKKVKSQSLIHLI